MDNIVATIIIITATIFLIVLLKSVSVMGKLNKWQVVQSGICTVNVTKKNEHKIISWFKTLYAQSWNRSPDLSTVKFCLTKEWDQPISSKHFFYLLYSWLSFSRELYELHIPNNIIYQLIFFFLVLVKRGLKSIANNNNNNNNDNDNNVLRKKKEFVIE